MHRFSKGLLAAGAAMLMMFTGAAPASAASASAKIKPDPTASVVIGGHQYGPKDGLVYETQQSEITPGGGLAGLVSAGVGGYTYWGYSYWSSVESADSLRWTAGARAAGNVYYGQRIIQVCVWYTRGGVNVGSKVCSNAKNNGSAWSSGLVASTWVWDDLRIGAKYTTYSHYSTYRIAPGII